MRPTLIIAAAAGFAALPILSGLAWAQANRTFVSGQGSDANPCTLAAPCRSFAQALSQTNAGGEIAVLDTAGYGVVTINKAISIINQDGVEAGVTLAVAGTAITINAGVSDVVNLRGLTLEGSGVGTNGIVLNSAGGLNIQSCVVRNFTNVGILLQPANPNPNASFTVIDTIVANDASIGIDLTPASGIIPNGSALFLSLKHDTLIANGDGFQLNAGVNTDFQGSLHATIVDVAALANTGNGFAVHSQGLATGSATLYHSQVSGAKGVLSDASFITLSGTLLDTINGGSFTIANNGVISTTGDNSLGSGTGGSLSPLPLK